MSLLKFNCTISCNIDFKVFNMFLNTMCCTFCVIKIDELLKGMKFKENDLSCSRLNSEN